MWQSTGTAAGQPVTWWRLGDKRRRHASNGQQERRMKGDRYRRSSAHPVDVGHDIYCPLMHDHCAVMRHNCCDRHLTAGTLVLRGQGQALCINLGLGFARKPCLSLCMCTRCYTMSDGLAALLPAPGPACPTCPFRHAHHNRACSPSHCTDAGTRHQDREDGSLPAPHSAVPVSLGKLYTSDMLGVANNPGSNLLPCIPCTRLLSCCSPWEMPPDH